MAATPHEAAAQSAPGPQDTKTLEEIVVTAQHKAENAQKTPIAMSVYSASQLKDNAITDVQSLSAVAPDVNFANTQGQPIITVRGISSRDINENGDPAVTVNVDGFYMNRPYSLNATIYDLERVEVLRGPQGTLNGRNSVGGAVNIITAKPARDFAAYTSLEYGNYNDLNLQGMVNLPVTDTVQVRAAFLSASHDGYRKNPPQTDGDSEDNKSGRLEIAFEPVANFKGLITLQYTSQGGTGDVTQDIPYVYTATGALDKSKPSGINSERFSMATPPSLDSTEKLVRYNFVYDLEGVEFTVLGGYDQYDWQHVKDSSNPSSDPSVYEFRQNEKLDTYNAEFRMASRGGGRLQWQAGAFFYGHESSIFAADAAPLTNGTFNEFFGFVYSTKARSSAGYGQASYQITDKLKFTAGVRYTSDYKEEHGYFGNLSANIVYANQSGSASSSKPTFHGALDYALTPANLIYGKVDTGYKAGGFNFGGAAYHPETVTAYEIGSKNRFLNDTIQLNLSAFYNDYTNQQVSTFAFVTGGNPVALTLNAGASTIYGAEADLVAKIPTLGTLSASLDYLHARYTNFLSVADPSDPKASGNVQLAGNTPPQAPTWSVHLGLEHAWEFAGGVLTGRIQSKMQTATNFSFYNYQDTRQDGYTMSDAFLTYAPAGGHWKVTGFVKNFENSVVFTNAEENQYAVSYSYEFFPPRTYGVRMEYSW